MYLIIERFIGETREVGYIKVDNVLIRKDCNWEKFPTMEEATVWWFTVFKNAKVRLLLVIPDNAWVGFTRHYFSIT